MIYYTTLHLNLYVESHIFKYDYGCVQFQLSIKKLILRFEMQPQGSTVLLVPVPNLDKCRGLWQGKHSTKMYAKLKGES